MLRTTSVFLKSEDGSQEEDVSAEVVAAERVNANTGELELELHFGLHPRAGFVGNRYCVTVKAGNYRVLPPRKPQDVEGGYQFNGELQLLAGRIVIDDPLSRPKPLGKRADYLS